MAASCLPHSNNTRQCVGSLFDLPGGDQTNHSASVRGGASTGATRCRKFSTVPAGASAYLMRHIIHDWTDDQCLTILTNIHRAMSATSRLLVVESVILTRERSRSSESSWI